MFCTYTIFFFIDANVDKLSHIEKDHLTASDDKQSLQSQLIAKNELVDRVTQERDEYIHMIEQRNNQLNEISLTCERANMQVSVILPYSTVEYVLKCVWNPGDSYSGKAA